MLTANRIESATGPERGQRRLWLLGGLSLIALLAWSWWEILFLPFGDSHDGRIHGRFGLQVQNLFDQGLIGSNLLSSMEPFTSQPYANHPPLVNVVHAATTSVLGVGEWQLHLLGFIAGLVTVAAFLWLGYELGFRASVATGAAALVVSTPMFWIYARLGLGLSLVLVFMALWVRQRRATRSRSLTVVATALAFSSWPGAALVLLTAGVGWRQRDQRGVARRVLMGAMGAVGATLLWAWVATSAGELVDHTSSRVQWPVGFGEFVDQYRWFYATLFPSWFRWSIPAMIGLAVGSRRTRSVALPMLVVSLAWTFALPQAAFIHDYWTYPLLVPIGLGWMVALRWLIDQHNDGRLVLGAVLILALGTFVNVQRAGFREAYFHVPADAGALVSATEPALGQEMAWVAGIDVPRWLSYYWDLPTASVDGVGIDTIPAGDFVLIRLDQIVEPTAIPVARRGRYALFRAGDLRSG